MKETTENNKLFIEQIKLLLRNAQLETARSVNHIMVKTYFELGKRIVENEQEGSKTAEYGEYILQNLSKELTEEFGKGYSKRNLELVRKFYLTYSFAKSAISQSLTWTHYLHLMRIQNEAERNFYEIETVSNNWSVREMSRQINSSLYERLQLGKGISEIRDLSNNGQLIEKPFDIIKDPYVLEFLNIPNHSAFNETEFESALIDNLEKFMLELGKGFTFAGRQVRFTFDEEHYRIDLVFYNRLLKSFVLIDLKIGKLKHQDIGQMQMYVNYYDRFIKTTDENDTIGIILCKDKKDSMVEITLPKNNKQIFASKYQLYLPTENQLLNELKKVDM